MQKNTNRKMIMITSWILVLVWMGVIFNFSSQTASESSEISGDIADTVYIVVDETFPNAEVSEESIEITTRNIAHFVLYFGLGFLLLNALDLHEINKIPKTLLALIIAVLYSLTDEWHQEFVQGRGFEFLDLAIDFAGSLSGIFTLFLLAKIKNRNKTNLKEV